MLKITYSTTLTTGTQDVAIVKQTADKMLVRELLPGRSFRLIGIGMSNFDSTILFNFNLSIYLPIIFSNLPFLLGGDKIHAAASADGFRNIDIRKEVLEHEIVNQLEEFVDKCTLHEGSNYYLSLELALGIVIGTLRNIHRSKRRMNLSSYLPISIESADYGIRYQEAYHHFQDLLLEEKIKTGIVKKKWKGR